MAGHRIAALPRHLAVVLTIGVLVLGSGTAFALDLDDPVDDLTDTVEDVVEEVEEVGSGSKKKVTEPVEEVVEPIEGTLEETIGTVNDTIKELTQPAPAGGGEPDGQGGGPGGGGGGDEGRSSPSGTSEQGSAPVSDQTDEGGAVGLVTSEAGSAADRSWGTIASRGVLAALDRAFGLAGPLAPPLVLAGIALIALSGASRGPSRLLKADVGGRFPEQSYKL